MREITAEITSSLMQSHDATGILLYGSAARDFHSAADIDVICITRTDGHRHFMTIVGHKNLDVYAGSRKSLERALRLDRRDNNNFVLNAFMRGLPLMELDDSLNALTSISREVWQAGPQEPDRDEVRAIELSLIKGLHAAKTHVDRIGMSPERDGIARISLGQSFLRAVYAYCRRNGLWSSTLSEMLEWSGDAKYQVLIALCSRFLRTSLFEEQIKVLSDLTQRIMNQKCEGRRAIACN